MARSLQLVVLIHLRLPAVGSPNDPLRARAWRDCLEPLIGALHHTPDTKVGLAISGEVLEEFQAEHPEAIEWIRDLVERGQVELVGTALHEPVLSAVPERDGTAQIQVHATLLKKIFGHRPSGCWLPHGVWDPSLPRVFARAGMRWTALDERRFVEVGMPPDQVHGVYRTEREGFGIALLPSDQRLADQCGDAQVKQVFVHLRRRAQRGHTLVTLPIEAHHFGLRPGRNPRGDQTWLATLLAGLAKAAPTLTTVLPSQALARHAQRGTVYLPSGAPTGVGVPWERSLATYAEANRIHKRMLRVSRQVYKLERIVREGSHSSSRPDPERLVQAHRYLYRAQNADVYWHHQHAGIYDPALRERAWRDLLRAERVTLDAMRTRSRLQVESSDLDCDGVPEVLMRTPSASVIINPASGGGVTEFSIYQPARNLINTMTRVKEPYHDDPAVMGDLEDDDAALSYTSFEDDVPTTYGASAHTTTRALARDLKRGLGRDHQPRSCFVAYLLGAEVTLDNMRRGNHGTAATRLDSWQLVTQERRSDEALRAVLACDAIVHDQGADRRARINKRYTLHREPILEVRFEVMNRSHEALRTRFAVELNLTLGADPDAQSLVVGGSELSIDVPSDAGEVGQIRLQTADELVDIQVERPGRLWYYPIHTIHRSTAGVVRATQGVSLLFQWPIELWGKEKDRMTITLSHHSTAASG